MNLQQTWTNKRNNNSNATRLTIVLVIIYLVVLFWILIFKLGVQFSYMAERRVNLIPFSEALNSNGKIDYGESTMNILSFMRLGIYAGVLLERWTFAKNLFLFFSISLLFEGFQYIFRIGAFDITDIITNSIGGTIGLMLFKGIVKALNNRVKAQKVINILATIGTVVIISFLVLLKMNMLPIKYQ